MPRDLEQELEQAFSELQINSRNRNILRYYLKLVKQNHQPSYEHELRVGLKALQIGIELADLTVRLGFPTGPTDFFYDGILHDTGKCCIDPKLLSKDDEFNNEDMEEIKPHVIVGYEMLKGVYPLTARVLLLHHKFQGERSYPIKIPAEANNFTIQEKIATIFRARIIAKVDDYDAATYRKNRKHRICDERRYKTPEEVKQIMLEHSPNEEALINRIYNVGIFGKDTIEIQN